MQQVVQLRLDDFRGSTPINKNDSSMNTPLSDTPLAGFPSTNNATDYMKNQVKLERKSVFSKYGPISGALVLQAHVDSGQTKIGQPLKEFKSARQKTRRLTITESSIRQGWKAELCNKSEHSELSSVNFSRRKSAEGNIYGFSCARIVFSDQLAPHNPNSKIFQAQNSSPSRLSQIQSEQTSVRKTREQQKNRTSKIFTRENNQFNEGTIISSEQNKSLKSFIAINSQSEARMNSASHTHKSLTKNQIQIAAKKQSSIAIQLQVDDKESPLSKQSPSTNSRMNTLNEKNDQFIQSCSIQRLLKSTSSARQPSEPFASTFAKKKLLLQRNNSFAVNEVITEPSAMWSSDQFWSRSSTRVFDVPRLSLHRQSVVEKYLYMAQSERKDLTQYESEKLPSHKFQHQLEKTYEIHVPSFPPRSMNSTEGFSSLSKSGLLHKKIRSPQLTTFLSNTSTITKPRTAAQMFAAVYLNKNPLVQKKHSVSIVSSNTETLLKRTSIASGDIRNFDSTRQISSKSEEDYTSFKQKDLPRMKTGQNRPKKGLNDAQFAPFSEASVFKAQQFRMKKKKSLIAVGR